MNKRFFRLFLFISFFLSVRFAVAQQLPELGKEDVKKVIAAMTKEEKANIVKGIGMSFSDMADSNAPIAGRIQDKVPGAGGATYAIPRLGIPSLIVADGPAGVRIDSIRKNDSHRYYATAFPTGTSLASTWDTALVKKVGEAMGEEVKAFGLDILLGPALNIQRNPLGGRNFEYYSEDPLLSGTIAAAIVNGIQSNGVGTSVKHFAVNNQETSRNKVDAQVSQRALREIYLKGFEIAVKNSTPWTVMSSYNKINGTFASENEELLTRLLRAEWGFKGLVMTDWFAGRDYVAQVRAGNDLLMPGRKTETARILEALENGTLDEKILDANIERILHLILQSPSFKSYPYSNRPSLEKHAALTRQAGSAGIILLKNTKAALPLAPTSVALLGNASYDLFAGGTGSGEVNKSYTTSLYQGLKEAGFKLNEPLKESYLNHIATAKAQQPKRENLLQTIKPVTEYQPAESQLDALVAGSNIAVFTIGRNAGEGTDRSIERDYNLSQEEQELLRRVADKFHAKGKKLVVVLNVDAPVDVTKWQDLADAVLLAWLPGMEAGRAIADIICGKVNPSARLAVTLPVRYGDEPSAGTFPDGSVQRPDSAVYREGIYVGYRYFNSFGVKPAYPFGYGLSYTRFNYSNLVLNKSVFEGKLTATVTITNTGKRAGSEVVQLYLSAPAKTLDKPASELKGFAKTELLKPGSAQTISFVLHPRDLASFYTEQSAWVAEAGNYKIMVGASSEDIRLTGSFALQEQLVVEKVSNLLVPQKVIPELKSSR